MAGAYALLSRGSCRVASDNLSFSDGTAPPGDRLVITLV